MIIYYDNTLNSLSFHLFYLFDADSTNTFLNVLNDMWSEMHRCLYYTLRSVSYCNTDRSNKH